MTELHLQYNLLKDITGALEHLTQLQVLMLQGNQLTNLEKVVREFRKMLNLQILSKLINFINIELFVWLPKELYCICYYFYQSLKLRVILEYKNYTKKLSKHCTVIYIWLRSHVIVHSAFVCYKIFSSSYQNLVLLILCT